MLASQLFRDPTVSTPMPFVITLTAPISLVLVTIILLGSSKLAYTYGSAICNALSRLRRYFVGSLQVLLVVACLFSLLLPVHVFLPELETEAKLVDLVFRSTIAVLLACGIVLSTLAGVSALEHAGLWRWPKSVGDFVAIQPFGGKYSLFVSRVRFAQDAAAFFQRSTPAPAELSAPPGHVSGSDKERTIKVETDSEASTEKAKDNDCRKSSIISDTDAENVAAWK